MSSVFLSYRREDSQGYAGALLRELNDRLGADEVFMDVEDIPGGVHFPSLLHDAVCRASVVVVLIDPHWLEVRNAEGGRRLDDAQEIGVCPLFPLIDGARMPAASELPEPIATLASFNALALSNVHWREDVARLFDHIKEAIYARGVALAGGATVAADFTPEAPKSESLGWVYVLLALFFVIFGGAAAWLGYETLAFRAQASSADGEVVALRRHVNDEGAVLFRPEVVFAPDGGEAVGFVGSVGSIPPAYSVGERVRVLYDPARPGEARLDDASEWLLPAIFGLFAAIFGVVVGVMLWLRVRKRRRFRRLRVERRPIVTTFERVEQITSITVNDRHPYVIVSNWRHPVTGRMVEFRSQHIWDDPTQQASKRMITVVIDPDDFGNCMMDLGFLGRGR